MTQESPECQYFLQVESLPPVDKQQQGGAGYIWQRHPANVLQLCSRLREEPRQPLYFEDIVRTASVEKVFKPIDTELYELLIAVPCWCRVDLFNEPERVRDARSITVGCEVTVVNHASEYSGIVRCITNVKKNKGLHFGIELDEEFAGQGLIDGKFQGVRYFDCPTDRGMFVAFHKLRLKPFDVTYEGLGYIPRVNKSVSLPVTEVSKAADHSIRSKSWNMPSQYAISLGERVVWLSDRQPEYATVKWIGTLPDSREITVGVEFDNPVGTGTGSYKARKLFDAKRRHASLVPIMGLLRAADFDCGNEASSDVPRGVSSPPSVSSHPSVDGTNGYSIDEPISDAHRSASIPSVSSVNSVQNSKGKGGARSAYFDTPSISVKGHVMVSEVLDRVDSLCGVGKGIQAAAQSSGSLESILFTMFFLYDSFDSHLFLGDNESELGEIKLLRKTLVEHIINPLRMHTFVSWHRVKKFREDCNFALSSCNLITANPSEVFCHIVGNIVRMKPLFTLSTQEPYNVYEIPQVRSLMSAPNIQHLLDCASLASNHRIQSVPDPFLVLDFCSSSSGNVIVFPSRTIDISDLIEEFPRECKICGVAAERECADCFIKSETDDVKNLSDITFCVSCYERYHQTANRRDHRASKELNPSSVSVTHQEAGASDVSTSRVTMELFAVVSSVERRFVSFVKCGSGLEGGWLMHDSMAEKTDDGSLIPEIRRCDEIEECFSVVSAADIGTLPTVVRHMIMGIRLCFYRRLIFNE